MSESSAEGDAPPTRSRALGWPELLITLGLLFVVFFLGGGAPARISELTSGEVVIVVLASLVLAIGAFAAALRWVRDARQYVGALLIAGLISLFVAGVLTDRVRGPACLSDEINDPLLCKAPPRGVTDKDAWWQGWGAAEGIMIASGCVGAAIGSLVKLEIRSARAA